MSFDAGVTHILAAELDEKLRFSRVEKIFQPSKDTFVFLCHPDHSDVLRLIIDVSSSHPHICFSETDLENPKVPPMMCMLLRKHLSGARITDISSPVFDRIIKISFLGRDALGYENRKTIYIELTGRYSNLIFCDGETKVISAVKTSDITSNELRPIYPGAEYVFPPVQEGKRNPLEITPDNYIYKDGVPSERAFMNAFYGVSPLVSRIVYQHPERVFDIINAINDVKPVPTVLFDENGNPADFSFIDFGAGNKTHPSDMLEAVSVYYSERAISDRISRRTSDLEKLLQNTESRLENKLSKQKEELERCGEKDKYKRLGDVITSNIFRLEKGMTSARLTDYYDENCPEIEIELDKRLSPSQNAARYYKLYNKCKSAEDMLGKQIAIAQKELEYIKSVSVSLKRVENENDINDIRRELADGGYLRKDMANVPKKLPVSEPLYFRTTNGIDVLCGKNNRQNDSVTFSMASKSDIWFHIKGCPGSHVVLLCGDTEPDAVDYTDAATIAATYSDAKEGETVAVDYTRIKNVKKPPSSKPGFVTFSQNYSAYVRPNREYVKSLAIKKD